MNEERIVALEMHAAQMQVLLEELSGVLHEQERELQSLREAFRRVQSRVEQTEAQTPLPRPERPPHY